MKKALQEMANVLQGYEVDFRDPVDRGKLFELLSQEAQDEINHLVGSLHDPAHPIAPVYGCCPSEEEET